MLHQASGFDISVFKQKEQLGCCITSPQDTVSVNINKLVNSHLLSFWNIFPPEPCRGIKFGKIITYYLHLLTLASAKITIGGFHANSCAITTSIQRRGIGKCSSSSHRTISTSYGTIAVVVRR